LFIYKSGIVEEGGRGEGKTNFQVLKYRKDEHQRKCASMDTYKKAYTL
jgi:hypothetical protein